MFRTILLLYVLLVIASGGAQSQDMAGPTEVWPEITVNYDPYKKVRLILAVRKESSEDTPDNTIETTATAIYRLRPLVRNALFHDDENDNEKKYMLSLAANYEFSRSFGSSTTSSTSEQRIMLDATPRYKLFGGLLLENRARSEFRFPEAGAYDYWFRNKLRLERKFKIKNFRFAPFAYAEAIWTKNARSWNRNVLTAGTEIALIRRRARLDVYFSRKNCDTCSQADVNAIGVNLQLFFGNR